MFRWLTKYFVKEIKEPETVPVPFVLPDGRKFTVEALNLNNRIDGLRCKQHPQYNGIKDPSINCNGCWEFHYQRTRISK